MGPVFDDYARQTQDYGPQRLWFHATNSSKAQDPGSGRKIPEPPCALFLAEPEYADVDFEIEDIDDF